MKNRSLVEQRGHRSSPESPGFPSASRTTHAIESRLSLQGTDGE